MGKIQPGVEQHAVQLDRVAPRNFERRQLLGFEGNAHLRGEVPERFREHELAGAGAVKQPIGDADAVAESLVHRARTGEIVISLDFMKALGAAVQTLGAQELPPLELSNRPPLPIYGMVLETRLDFT